MPCLGPRLLPPRAFLSAQGCLSDLPLNRVWKRVCVWGSRGQGACRGLHEGQGWVPGQPTNSDSRLVFCGGLSVPWKGTEGSVRHSVCPQQALHLGLNMGNTSPSKANSRHLPTHTKLLIPAHEPSTYHPAFFLKLLYLLPTSPSHPSPSWLSSSPSRISIYPTLFHSQQPGKKEHRPNKGEVGQASGPAGPDCNAPTFQEGAHCRPQPPIPPGAQPCRCNPDTRARTHISSSQSCGRKAGISDPQLTNGKTQVQRRVMMAGHLESHSRYEAESISSASSSTMDSKLPTSSWSWPDLLL